ncbi:MAG: pilin [Candidatus Saccharimonadales bacterium]
MKTVYRKIIYAALSMVMVFVIGGAASSPARAQTSSASASCQYKGSDSSDAHNNAASTAICPPQVCSASTTNPCNTDIIKNYLNPVIDFLGAGVGIVIVIAMVIGGIQYTTSGGDPNKAAAGKKRLIDALIALVAFGFMYALLKFFVPGPLF